MFLCSPPQRVRCCCKGELHFEQLGRIPQLRLLNGGVALVDT